MKIDVVILAIAVKNFTEGHEQTNSSIVPFTLQPIHQVIERIKVDEIVDGVRRDDELVGGTQADGGPEVAEGEGDGAAIVDVARVPQETGASEDLVLDRRVGNSRGFGAVHGAPAGSCVRE